MGSRGAFVNVNEGNFNFVNGGQNYFVVGEVDDVKILIKPNGSIGAPLYSHTNNRIYAIIQNGNLKYLLFYDDNHQCKIEIDFLHENNGMKPHVHIDGRHDPDSEYREHNKYELFLANKIRKTFGVK